jgi:hypothetical protein
MSLARFDWLVICKKNFTVSAGKPPFVKTFLIIRVKLMVDNMTRVIGVLSSRAVPFGCCLRIKHPSLSRAKLEPATSILEIKRIQGTPLGYYQESTLLSQVLLSGCIHPFACSRSRRTCCLDYEVSLRLRDCGPAGANLNMTTLKFSKIHATLPVTSSLEEEYPAKFGARMLWYSMMYPR